MKALAFILPILIVAGCAGPTDAPPQTTPVEPAALSGNQEPTQVSSGLAPDLQGPKAKPQALHWPANPPVQQVTAYQVFKALQNSNTLVATVTGTAYTPTAHGKYFVKAVNARGVSQRSNTVQD